MRYDRASIDLLDENESRQRFGEGIGIYARWLKFRLKKTLNI